MRDRFTVRVYGILRSEKGVLVSDEHIRGMDVTKFPGGGLEFGEGPADCLIREFREELDIDVKVLSHFYTTDFFVASAFNPQIQVISIYYEVETNEANKIETADGPFQYEKQHGAQRFRFIPLSAINEDSMTLIIDRKVAGMIASGHLVK